MDNLVIGLGTGRCGTKSLKEFLNENGIAATHEKFKLVWKPDKTQWDRISGDIHHDVGFYWLNYVELVLNLYADAKFICLKRNKEDVVRSYSKRLACPFTCTAQWIEETGLADFICYNDTMKQEDTERLNPDVREMVLSDWYKQYHIGPSYLSEYFPEYPFEDKEKCLRLFWDEYYLKSELLQTKYPNNFMIIDMHEALNTDDGRNRIKNFIGINPNTLMQ